jgi:hypothetical protein
MDKNVGAADSYIRALLGVAFLLNIFALKTGVIGTIVLLVLALISLFTAYTGFCVFYKILNISTSPTASAIPGDEPRGAEENKGVLEKEEEGTPETETVP